MANRELVKGDAAMRRDLAQLHAQGFDRAEIVGLADGIRVKCSGCEAAFIQGVPCHERDCPNQRHECRGCNATVARKGAYCEDCR